MKEKVHKAHLENLDVHTFHSLAVKYYVPSAHTDTELRHIIRHRLPLNALPKKSWDILVLDEAQDMSFLYYHFICLFLENLGEFAPRQLMVLGDHQQCLYQFKGADARFLTQAARIWTTSEENPGKFKGEMVACSLQTSYRITAPMADFVNRAMLGQERMLAPREGEPISVHPKFASQYRENGGVYHPATVGTGPFTQRHLHPVGIGQRPEQSHP
jgi:hypothetical protein